MSLPLEAHQTAQTSSCLIRLDPADALAATIEDTIRQEQPFPQAWLGQRVCYVHDESVTEDASL
nr:hypothetical protein [Pseudomonas sp. s4]